MPMHRVYALHVGGPRRICIMSNDIPRITKEQAGQHEESSANDLVAEMWLTCLDGALIYDGPLFRINGQTNGGAICNPRTSYV